MISLCYVKASILFEKMFEPQYENSEILNNGIEAGFQYFDLEGKSLNSKEILHMLDYMYMSNIVKIKVIYQIYEFFLEFSEEDDYFTFTIIPIEPYKMKQFENNCNIDFAYYIQLILKLCNNFVINSIEAKCF